MTAFQYYLHEWRRLEWAESLRYDLHGLTGAARAERLAHFISANSLPEASLKAFSRIAASLDNIRTFDECWMPEIPWGNRRLQGTRMKAASPMAERLLWFADWDNMLDNGQVPS